jgi:hypothetical protein
MIITSQNATNHTSVTSAPMIIQKTPHVRWITSVQTVMAITPLPAAHALRG